MTLPDPEKAGSAQAITAAVDESSAVSLDPARGHSRLGDKVFRGLAEGSGVLVVVLIAAIGLFLLWRAIPALTRNEENFFLFGGTWNTTDTSAMHFGVFELFQVTVFVSLFALALGIGKALGDLLRDRDRPGVGEAAIIEAGAGDDVADQVEVRRRVDRRRPRRRPRPRRWR